MDPNNHSQILKDIFRSVGDEARERALFWHFGRFKLGDHEPQLTIIERLALEEVIGERAGTLTENQLSSFSKACWDISKVFMKPVLKPSHPWKLLPHKERLSTLSKIPHDLHDLVEMQLDATGVWKLVARNREGRIISDGVNHAIAGLPLRSCEFCGAAFAPSRRDSKYCRSSCRSSDATARHRAAKKKEQNR